MTQQQNFNLLNYNIEKLTNTQQKNIFEYTKKQILLESFKSFLLNYNNINLYNHKEKNAFILEFIRKNNNLILYNKNFTIAFLNQNYYKILKDIKTEQEQEQEQKQEQTEQPKEEATPPKKYKVNYKKYYTFLIILYFSIFITILILI